MRCLVCVSVLTLFLPVQVKSIDYVNGEVRGAPIVLSGETELRINSGTAEQQGNISGVGDIRKLGAGELRLTGNNEFTGNARVEEGGLSLENGSRLDLRGGQIDLISGTFPGAAFTMNGGEIRNGETVFSGAGNWGGSIRVVDGNWLMTGDLNLTGVGGFPLIGGGFQMDGGTVESENTRWQNSGAPTGVAVLNQGVWRTREDFTIGQGDNLFRPFWTINGGLLEIGRDFVMLNGNFTVTSGQIEVGGDWLFGGNSLSAASIANAEIGINGDLLVQSWSVSMMNADLHVAGLLQVASTPGGVAGTSFTLYDSTTHTGRIEVGITEGSMGRDSLTLWGGTLVNDGILEVGRGGVASVSINDGELHTSEILVATEYLPNAVIPSWLGFLSSVAYIEDNLVIGQRGMAELFVVASELNTPVTVAGEEATAVAQLTLGGSFGTNNWTNEGLFVLGEQGAANLWLLDGMVTTMDLVLGQEPGSRGSASVTAELDGEPLRTADGDFVKVTSFGNGKLEVEGELVVGDRGIGYLDIIGGQVTSQVASIGRSEGGEGTLEIAGGSFMTSSDVIIGDAGHGLFSQTGGETRINGDLIIANQPGSMGAVQLGTGSSMISRSVLSGQGEASFTFDGGLLRLLEDRSDLFDGFADGSVVIQSGGATIDTQGFSISSGAVFSGPGGLTKLGDGTLILTGQHQYEGITTIGAGVVQVGDGTTSGSIPSDVVNQATLVFFPSDDVNYDGVISGPGTLIKRGAGNLTLTADHTFSGDTSIETGALILNGSLQSSRVLVDPGATLAGSGFIAGDVLVGGVLNPGNSPGRLTIQGNLEFGPESQLVVEADGTGAGEFDQVVVMGSILLDGTLAIELGEGFIPVQGDTFDFLEAEGGIEGEFREVTSNLSGSLEFDLVFGPEGSIQLEIAPVPFTNFMQTPNQVSLAASLDAERFFNPDGPFKPFFDVWNRLPTSDLPGTVEPLIPFQMSSAVTTTLSLSQSDAVRFRSRMREVRLAMADPLAAEFGSQEATQWLPAAPPTRSLWFEGGGDFQEFTATGLARSYSVEGGLANAGLDYQLSRDWVVGIFAGYRGAETEISGNLGTVGIDSGGGALYALYHSRDTGIYLQGMTGAYGNQYETTRNFLLNGFGSATARGETQGIEFASNGAIGWAIDWQGWQFSAQADIHYAALRIDGFREQGAFPFDVQYQRQTGQSLQSALNAEISRAVPLGDKLLLISANGGWRHEYLEQSQTSSGLFAAGLNVPFQVSSPGFGRDFAEAGGGLTLFISDTLSISARYDAQIGQDQLAHLVTVRLGWQW